MTGPIFGVAGFDQTDGTTYQQAVDRDVTNLGIKAGFVYFNASTSPTWADRCANQPSDHDIFVSTKKFTSDSQWISDHTTFAGQIPDRTGKVYMVCNEEPEADMTSTEFKRRWDLIKTIYQNHPYAVMSVQLAEYTFNPQSGRNWADYVPSYVNHVGVSPFAYLGDVQANDPTPHYEMAQRIITTLQAAGKTFSFSSVGCARLEDGSHPFGGTYCVRRAQWLYDMAEEAMTGGALHFMWWDFELVGSPNLDYRIRLDSDLGAKWTAAYNAWSKQATGGRAGPEPRAEAHASTGTGASVASITVAIPTRGVGGPLLEGDLAYLFWSESSGGLVTGLATPPGWTTLIAPTSYNGSTQAVALAY